MPRAAALHFDYMAKKKSPPGWAGSWNSETMGDAYFLPWLFGTKTVQVFVVVLPASSLASTVIV